MTTKTLKLSGKMHNPTDACGNEIKPGDPDYAEATAGKGETIEIKMGWSDCLIPLLAVYAEGSPKGRADALGELRRMARAADQHVADNPPASGYQIAEWRGDGSRWQFLAHGARYTADEARAAVERIEERGGKARLLPC